MRNLYVYLPLSGEERGNFSLLQEMRYLKVVVRWQAPESSELKIITDAAFTESNREFGAAAVCSDSNWKLLRVAFDCKSCPI